MVTDGSALNKEFSKSTDSLESTKSAFEKACKESELAQIAHKVKNNNKRNSTNINTTIQKNTNTTVSKRRSKIETKRYWKSWERMSKKENRRSNKRRKLQKTSFRHKRIFGTLLWRKNAKGFGCTFIEIIVTEKTKLKITQTTRIWNLKCLICFFLFRILNVEILFVLTCSKQISKDTFKLCKICPQSWSRMTKI